MNEKKYILDIDQLKPGDIILTVESEENAQIGEEKSGSRFTHAMLYVDHQINHATYDGGVFSLNPQRILFESVQDVKVLRYKKRLNKNVLNKVCDFTAQKVATLYSFKEAISSLKFNKSDQKSKTKKQFCSRLIAQAYFSQKIRIAKNPDYCLPADIEKSSKFSIVPQSLRLATPYDIMFSKTEDPNLLNQKVTYEWLNKTRELAKSKVDSYEIQTISDANRFVIEYPTYESEIISYIESSGYLDNYKTDMYKNEYRYNKDLFIQYKNKDMINIKNEFCKEPGLVTRYCDNLKNHTKNYHKFNDKFSFIHIKLYTELLSLAKIRLTNLLLLEDKIYTKKIISLLEDINVTIEKCNIREIL
ncbi:TPA: hypothetical protein ACX6RS_000492 [Photobacterium damselae]